jgi:hypothetical protein
MPPRAPNYRRHRKEYGCHGQLGLGFVHPCPRRFKTRTTIISFKKFHYFCPTGSACSPNTWYRCAAYISVPYIFITFVSFYPSLYVYATKDLSLYLYRLDFLGISRFFCVCYLPRPNYPHRFGRLNNTV